MGLECPLQNIPGIQTNILCVLECRRRSIIVNIGFSIAILNEVLYHIKYYSKKLKISWKNVHIIPARYRYGLLYYLHFAWKLEKASVEAFTASMEASMEEMEATEASMEAFMEAMEAVEASMEDM